MTSFMMEHGIRLLMSGFSYKAMVRCYKLLITYLNVRLSFSNGSETEWLLGNNIGVIG